MKYYNYNLELFLRKKKKFDLLMKQLPFSLTKSITIIETGFDSRNMMSLC